MDSLFGIPMDTIMLVLVVALGLCLASIAYVFLRNRIIFMMGLRNMPRRVAQSVLIVVGLMLSTLIISAAFTTGDTVDYSISNEAYKLMGHVDEAVQPGADRAEGGLGGAHGPSSTGRDIPGEDYQSLLAALKDASVPNVDGYMGMLYEEVPVINEQARLSEPAVTFVGLDQDLLAGFPDVVSSSSGKVLDVASLARDEAFMNKSAADNLDVKAGDVVQVWVENEPYDFRVLDIVEDRIVTGTRSSDMREGMVTRLDTLHELFKHDAVDFILISNNGGVRDTLQLTGQVEAGVGKIIRENGLDLGFGDSKQDGVDLAEEFGNFMATFFLVLGLFSIGSGILLIIMIFVMLAAERKSEMGMARAVGMKRNHLVQMFMSEGTAYNIVSAMVGAGLGILVAFGMAYGMAAIFSEFGISIKPSVTPRTFVISYSLGVVLTFVTVTFASWRVSKLNIVRAIRDIPDPTGRRMGWRGLAFWVLMIVVGALLFVSGMSGDKAFPFALGFSLVGAGVAVVLRFLRLPERPVFTLMGMSILILWGFVAGNRLEPIFGPLNGDIEMFFLSGVAMVTSSTFVLIYNSDIALALISHLGGAFGTILPAMKTAVAYPLNNKFRTGMTLAMISLVVFALTMMSTMNFNFDKLFLSDSARGGWDILVEENSNNPIADLPASLREGGSDAAEGFRAVGRISLAGGFNASEVREGADAEFEAYQVSGVDDGFVDGGHVPLEARAVGYDSEEAVWQALKTRDDVGLIDAFAVESGFGPQDFSVSSIPEGQDIFDPVTLEVRDPVSGKTKEVDIIGVIGFGSSSTFFGIFLPEQTFLDVFGEPELSWHYVGLKSPGKSKDLAKEIESTLLTAGVQAESIKERADREQALSRNFFYLMQAFMGLGLFVGIAAVGVIAFRTVVERRQQIGMLRAIGYKRNTVALSFLMESSFVTLLGIFSGIGLALWLSYFLVTSSDFPGNGSSYFVPWQQLTIIAFFTYGASLLMTFIPSRQAASIPVAEALRYE